LDFALRGEAVTAPKIHPGFAHNWQAEVLTARPMILPPRHFVYPREVDEVERGALEVLVRPTGAEPFLATCALGFRDQLVPTGLWTAPNPNEICAVCGGYVYLIDTQAPERFTMLPYKPVLAVFPALDQGLLLFVGHHAIFAWGAEGEAWQSEKLSDEGVTVTGIENGLLHGRGWQITTDKEMEFTLDLRTGARE
jgi:hypothetical protein